MRRHRSAPAREVLDGEPPWDPAERERLLRARVGDLTAAGATYVREEHDGADLGHVVMLDPEGNELCVA